MEIFKSPNRDDNDLELKQDSSRQILDKKG